MSKQVNYNENLCSGAAIRDDKGRRISKLFEASHPKMTVGYAKNLIMPNDPTEQKFNFRQAGGGVIEDGVAVIDKVKGNSVVWNQLADALTSSKWTNRHNNVTYLNNVLTYNKTPEIEYAENYPIENHAYFKSGHKYLCTLVVTNVNNGTIQFGESDTSYLLRASTIGFHYGFLVATTNDQLRYLTVGTSISVKDVSVYDLTQMFGAGNEPTTYEEFLQCKPKVADEYAYNEGEIINNKVEKVVTTGRNLWDEEWEVGSIKISTGEDLSAQDRIRIKGYLPVLPNTSYYCTLMNTTGGNGYFCYYDQNKKFIAYDGDSSHYEMNKVFTTPSNCYFVRFYLNVEYGKTYNHDICINLSDPAINGKYFPYEKHELDLSWVKEIKDADGVKLFEDGMKSAGTAFDEVGKNKAAKRIGVVNLGNLNWEPGVQTGQYRASDFKQLRPSKNKSLVCANYTTREDGGNMQDDSKDLWVWNNVGGGSGYYPEVLVAKDTRYSSAQAFKQAVQGVLLYYELAEPIEVEYDEKSLTYPVVAGGTEEAIASEPSSAFRADIGYGIDAVKTILDLKARVEALEGK